MKHIQGVAILALFFLIGCSGGNDGPPVLPDITEPAPAIDGPFSHNRIILTAGAFDIELGTLKATYHPDRSVVAHYNVTGWLMPPDCPDCIKIEVLELKPLQKYIELKVSLSNTTSLTVYDVRGIVITNIPEIRLVNAEAYTDLWDDGGDVVVNPFKAFATDWPKRAFKPDTGHARIYEIEYSTLAALSEVTFVVDASWPGNCLEPYSISEFHQANPLSTSGGSTDVRLTVLDWQDDAGQVFIDASPVGAGIIELNQDAGNEWMGIIKTEQSNPGGIYNLLVSAGTSGNPALRLFHYFPLTILEQPCFEEGNETWEDAFELPPGQDSGEQVVCNDDKKDWFEFTSPIHLAGSIKLELLNDTGQCDITLYHHPDVNPIISKIAAFGHDAILSLDELNLGHGLFYMRVRHVGNDSATRLYILDNNVLSVPCEEEGNETWEDATLLPMGDDSGNQVVCGDDEHDWYRFTCDDPIMGDLTLEMLNDTGVCEIAVYDNPGSSYLLSQEATFDTPALLDLEPLLLGDGEYYIRISYIGTDTYTRQYILSNNTAYWPCEPEGNEYWENADWLKPGNQTGLEEVCKFDREDWYRFYIYNHLLGEIRLTLLNDTGGCDLALFSNPYEEYDLLAEASFGSDAVIEIPPHDFGYGTYYIRVRFLGDDYGVREYELFNDTSDPLCHFDDNEDWLTASDLSCETLTTEYVCLDDKQDWYKIILDEPVGVLELSVTDETGPADMTLYSEAQAPEPSGPNLASVEADPSSVISISDLGLGTGTYYLRIRHVGDDELFRKYKLLFTRIRFGWVRTWGGSFADAGIDIAIDDFNNVYTVGKFRGTVDLDPGPGVEMHSSEGEYDIYLSKLNTDGELQWARTWGGDDSFTPHYYAYQDLAIALDDSGNVYVTGLFMNAPDFDPGSGEQIYSSNGEVDVFLSKFDSAGIFQWARTWGGAEDEEAYALAVDADGNIYAGGSFRSTVDFDPGPGTDNHTAVGGTDAYLASYDPYGGFRWAHTWGGTSNDVTNGAACDNSGNIFAVGGYVGTVDFDPGPGVEEHISTGGYDAFMSKFNTDGDFQQAYSWGGAEYDFCDAVAIDGDGNVYIAGAFEGTADFDPGPGEDLKSSNGWFDICVSKFDSGGSYVWSRVWGGDDYDIGYHIALDAAGNVYTTGCFYETVDFDPGPGHSYRSSNGWFDSWISSCTPDGDFRWAATWGGESYDFGYAIALDSSKSVYATGYFSDIVDFDPGVGIYESTSNGYFDGYLLKLYQEGD